MTRKNSCLQLMVLSSRMTGHMTVRKIQDPPHDSLSAAVKPSLKRRVDVIDQCSALALVEYTIDDEHPRRKRWVLGQTDAQNRLRHPSGQGQCWKRLVSVVLALRVHVGHRKGIEGPTTHCSHAPTTTI
jgi:hypothetical protein